MEPIYGLNRRANMDFSVAGIQKINEGLLQALNEELGLVGVFVVPKDIDRQDGTDNREDPETLVFLGHHQHHRRSPNFGFRNPSW